MGTEVPEGDAPATQTLEGMVGLEALGVVAKADWSLTAVEVVDTTGAGFRFLLGLLSAVDLAVPASGLGGPELNQALHLSLRFVGKGGRSEASGAAWMPARTPMGDAVSGSRLDRLATAQLIMRELRERGMTQRRICRQVGVSAALVSSWAKGKQTPSAEQLAALRELIREGGRWPRR